MRPAATVFCTGVLTDSAACPMLLKAPPYSAAAMARECHLFILCAFIAFFLRQHVLGAQQGIQHRQ